MEKKHSLFAALLSVILLFASSCSSYLDELPDNRTDLNTEQAIAKLLVSAYPITSFAMIGEMTSDNTDCNGGTWTSYNLLQEQLATWKDATEIENDSPQSLWEDCYLAIATCNQALQAIEKMGNPTSLNPQKGEALLCRAYAHFILANVFCQHYSETNGNKDLGIFYATEPETTVSPSYKRLSVADTYKKIDKDIEEGLPLIDDATYEVPKYHFNKKAAYAFACRFNLYYRNYDKVIEYAEKVLTANPSAMLRDWQKAGKLSGNGGIRSNEFVSERNKATLLVTACRSSWAYIHGPFHVGEKYTHNNMISSTESSQANGPWGDKDTYYYDIPEFQGTTKVIMNKMYSYFEMSDPVNGIGYNHIMYPAFTTDEILLCRAEAYTMKSDFDKATEDLVTWIHAFTKTEKTIDRTSISRFYGNMKYYTPEEPTPKKELHPDFTITPGEQENFIHAILHMRRILTMHEGLRWFDVKRYGIEIYRRTVYNNEITVTDKMPANDHRRAIQIPQDVINAGMEANPRQ